MTAFEPVSVVLTCYNLESYIGAAIESVVAQDYRGAIEIIVVDDCSTDRSLETIRRYVGVDIVRLDENCGVLNAMLAGIRRASHEIVMLLDGDDIWEASKVSETVRAFDEAPNTALVTHDLRFIDANDNLIERTSIVELKFRNVQQERCSDALIAGIINHHDYVWLGSALSFRKSRSRIDDFYKFCETLPDAKNTYQDWPLAYWIASIPDARLGIIKNALLRYRVHGRNYSGDSETIEKAVRNARRSLNTALAMQAIAASRNLNRKAQRNAALLVHYYRFMLMCYSGVGAKAAVPFILSLPFILRERHLVKELLRFLSFMLLSPRHAAALIARSRRGLRGTSSPA